MFLIPALTSYAQFSSVVEKYITVQADTFSLIHAKITDGSGSPSRPDQTLIIIKGIIEKTVRIIVWLRGALLK
jgi:hypothetical protein